MYGTPLLCFIREGSRAAIATFLFFIFLTPRQIPTAMLQNPSQERDCYFNKKLHVNAHGFGYTFL